MYRRKTITVSERNWHKYCKLKAQQLLEAKSGRDELNFTEFANICMDSFNLTLQGLREYRKKHMS